MPQVIFVVVSFSSGIGDGGKLDVQYRVLRTGARTMAFSVWAWHYFGHSDSKKMGGPQ